MKLLLLLCDTFGADSSLLEHNQCLLKSGHFNRNLICHISNSRSYEFPIGEGKEIEMGGRRERLGLGKEEKGERKGAKREKVKGEKGMGMFLLRVCVMLL